MERKRVEDKIGDLNRLYSMLSDTKQATVRIADREKLLQEVCRITVEQGLFLMAWIGIIDSKRNLVKPVAWWGSEEGYLDKIRISVGSGPEGRGPTGRAIREGRYFICNDIERDPLMLPWRAEALKRGYRSSAAFPLHGEGSVIGAFSVYAGEVHCFDNEKIRRLEGLAADISLALDSLEQEKRRKRAEEALRQSEDKYRTIFETTGTATIIIEEDTTISLANREFEKLSGYSREEVEGRMRWTDFIADKDDLEKMKVYHTARRVDPDAAPRNYEYRFIDKKGKVKDIFSTAAVFPGTKKSVGSFLDITERKQNEEALRKSEEQLRFLSTQLMSAQENERTRIAQELHDDLGQILSAIKFGVEDVLHQLGEGVDTPGGKTLKALIPVVQNGVEEVRRICMALHPSILDDLGILATISWFCREFQAIYSGIRIEKQIDVDEQEVPDLLKIVIYRVMQEALNNIAKHSEADLVHLSLKKQDNRVELGIKDNGRGFDLEVARSAERSKRGLGLASMKERVHFSGGSFFLESLPGAGTLIRASWPTP